MNYKELSNFIDKHMRMSHVYQPIMLIELLLRGGKLKTSDIAKALLINDQSQIEYYTKITNNMVGRVLKGHAIVEKHTKNKTYELLDFDSYTEDQIHDLVLRCQKKLDDFMEKRGSKIFDHRRKSSGYISGSIRYEILKRSKFHCELCGISADKKALEVDHILPRNKGGSDDQSNLQALCYSCNAMKQDRDDTNLRIVRESYSKKEADCIFCNPQESNVLFQNELAFAFQDGFPITEKHCLIIPKRHIDNYFDLGQAEINSCSELLNRCKQDLMDQDASITGFNIGVNIGESAGQTIMHCHMHLIPRRNGDTQNPIGGVRNIFPDKADYTTLTSKD